MAKDFLSNQIRVNKIIGSNNTLDQPKLIVYPNTRVLDDAGGINPNMLSNVGSDAFLFVSGAIGGKEQRLDDTVSVFGGDVVVSGTLYAERQVIEVDEVLPGFLYVSGSLAVTGSSVFNIDKSSDSDFIVKTIGKDNAIRVDSLNNTIQFMSGGSPTSPDESTYTDTNFFVSGSIGSAHQPELGQVGNGERGTGVFGGDLVVSGNMWVAGVNIGGNQISLKGYRENGEFTPSSTVTGNDSIALGFENNIESDKSFILGSHSNEILGKTRLSNVIIGSENSEISGSNFSIIIGGSSNQIHESFPAYSAFSDNVDIQGSEVLALYSDNLFASGVVSNSVVVGNNNRIEGRVEGRSDDLFILGQKNEVNETSRSLILNFADSSRFNPGNSDNPSPNTAITGSKNTLLFSAGADYVSGSYDNKLFLESSNVTKTSGSFVNVKSSVLDKVEDSFISAQSANIEDVKRLVAISGKNNTIKDDSVSSLVTELNNRGLNEYTPDTGLNVLLGNEYSEISGSYVSMIGGAKNKVSGSYSSIFGSIYSSITNSSGSVILGGLNNTITNNQNFILGTDNTANAERSFLVGKNLISSNDDEFIIGEGTNSNASLILSASKFEFGNLTVDKVYGDDTNFFVSGSIGARERFLQGSTVEEEYYGVAVFGGDLHVSGNLSGGNFDLDNVFFDGGDTKGRARSLGNNDDKNLSLLTDGIQRVIIEGSSGSLNLGGFADVGQHENVQLHIRTGSIGSYEFESSKDKAAAKNYPLLISRNVQQVINEQNPLVKTEVGLAFSSYPTLTDNSFDRVNQGLEEEPGAAITHEIIGRHSKGNLLFKTKKNEGQLSLGEAPSLTTKLKITNEGELLLGNDNPQSNYIDLRVTGSNHPLIQASGSLENNRGVFIAAGPSHKGKNQSDTVFHVYGTPGSKVSSPSNRLVSSFGGDVVISGSLYVEQFIDITGSLKIEGDIESKDADLTIVASNDINLNATNDVKVLNDLDVTNNITGSNIKGSGVEVSNVNMSSVWEDEGGGILKFSGAIDGNTGLTAIDLVSTLDLLNPGSGNPKIVYYPTTNTRLYDTYYEIRKNNLGQVEAWNPDTHSFVTKPIDTERVTSPEHLVISLK